MESDEFRVLVKHCFLKGKTTEQTKEWLDKRYPDSPFSLKIICRWYADFSIERSLKGAHETGRCGCSNSATVKGIQSIQTLYLDDGDNVTITDCCGNTMTHRHSGMQGRNPKRAAILQEPSSTQKKRTNRVTIVVSKT